MLWLIQAAVSKNKSWLPCDVAAVVRSHLVGTHDGTILMPFYNWSKFFDSHMTQSALKGISLMHHFHFFAFNLRVMFMENSCNDTEKEILLLKTPWQTTLARMPNTIPPPGLVLERQWYLFKKITEFFPDKSKDIICPNPLVPLPL